MFKKYVAILTTVFALSTANAVSFNLTVDTWLNDSFLYGGNATISLNEGLNWKNVNAGQFKAVFNGPVYDSYPNSWITYCTDVDLTLKGGFFEPVLWENIANVSWAESDTQLVSSLYLTFKNTITSNQEAVALQLAIWDAIYDGGDGFSTGKFQSTSATGDALTLATQYLNSSLVEPQEGTWWKPVTSSGEYRRNQGLIGNAVPEPGSTLVASLIGLVGLGLLRKRMV